MEDVQEVSTVEEPAGIVPDSQSQRINIKERGKRISGLSLSGLQAKREHEIRNQEVIADTIIVDQKEFTEEELQELWAAYADRLVAARRPILASILRISRPILKEGPTIRYTLPNHSMKKELEMEKEPLLRHLRNTLTNGMIQLELLVDEKEAERLAYTPEEKYAKFKAKNPALDELRKTFGLEL